VAIAPLQHVELNCQVGPGSGPHAWGLMIRVAMTVWGESFQ
jgi:hypothetical protein